MVPALHKARQSRDRRGVSRLPVAFLSSNSMVECQYRDCPIRCRPLRMAGDCILGRTILDLVNNGDYTAGGDQFLHRRWSACAPPRAAYRRPM